MNFLNSSIGKKIQIAISGIFLAIFLLFHLANNLVLFAGAEQFNKMVHFLESIKPIIRIMEAGLLFILLTHTINAIQITLLNKKQKPINYANKEGAKVSTLNSRTMAISGTIILLFFIIHLGYIWLTYQTHNFSEAETYYDVLLRNQPGYLNHTPTAIFYIVAIFLIGYHLQHGFQSALKTLGFSIKSFSMLYKLSFIFWGLIPMGFIIIILSIQLGFIK
tara:strand:- start:309 stop:968 length:660 start_codon:yes stop_codon:yes gene_type:complete